MEPFSFSHQTSIKNFLNIKFLTILRIIYNNPNIFTKVLLEKLKKNEIQHVKSQIYRYIECLEKFNLIMVNSWVRSSTGSGYSYNILPKGINVLDFLSKYFE